MEIHFKPRMNFLTGDNGLGKTFLLDIAWWVLTRTWARMPAIPPSAGDSRGHCAFSTMIAQGFGECGWSSVLSMRQRGDSIDRLRV